MLVLIASVFTLGVFAEGSESETDAAEVDVLSVHCPECENMGLEFKSNDDGKYYYTCMQKECGYMYNIVCPFCGGNDFEIDENGLYVCQGVEKDGVYLACGQSLTVLEIEDNLKIAKKPSGGKMDMDLNPEGFSDRLEYAVQGTVTGILMVFAVLTLLTLILYGSKYVFYDMPNKRHEKALAQKAASAAEVDAPKSEPAVVEAAPVAQNDDGELIAVITAAVAAMIDGSEYKDEFVGGFRVVSFKRSEKTAWNRK